MNGIYFQGFWRMDWGPGNPNKTGTLIEILMVAVWIFGFIWRKGFWASLVVFSGFGVCLVHTFSRGGIVAAVVGLCPLILLAPRPWLKARLFAVIGAVWLIVGASVFLQAHERLGQGIIERDPSISNRFDIWKMTPTMMVDAPGGWGIGNSGKAFMEWYQPLDRFETYRTLVNSHLTWLVELGWPGRFAYIALWIAAFVLICPSPKNTWLAVPFGVWLALFVSASFTSVAESIWLWIVPAGMLLWVIGWRIKSKEWPTLKVWARPPSFAAVALILIYVVSTSSIVQKQNGIVYVNGSHPDYWVVRNKKILGDKLGRPLRAVVPNQTGSAFGIIETIEDLPNGAQKEVILAGAISTENFSKLDSAKCVTIVNPAFYPQEFPLF